MNRVKKDVVKYISHPIISKNSDLVYINDWGHTIIISAHQLNEYYHTLLGNPFLRLKYLDPITQQYNFYRTRGKIRSHYIISRIFYVILFFVGIMSYIITYYVRKGSLTTDTNYPPEILYDELVFFGFNQLMIYQIISNMINNIIYIPSGKYRRCLWFIYDYHEHINIHHFSLSHILSTLVSICSVISSLVLIELQCIHEKLNDKSSSILKIFTTLSMTLIAEIFILVYFNMEVLIRTLIRPLKFLKFNITPLLFLINLCAIFPFALFLFISHYSNLRRIVMPEWLYIFIVFQMGCRIFRLIQFSTHGYELVRELTYRSSVYFCPMRSMTLIVIIFALFVLACEQVPHSETFYFFSNKTKIRSFIEIIWLSMNSYTSLGEGDIRPTSLGGMIVEFFNCFLGIITIPQFAQLTFLVASNTIDRRANCDKKLNEKHLVLIEDEYSNRAIAQIEKDSYLPEVLIEAEAD
ncbi:unnamed protein product [Didymodactylos carnosus]|uniref:Potassium channel domain-containing protein n=1 Tax=Didymodactylos carnosus TaxID=1234261 RepID=A0A814RW34_9BILA|nr:unnamed protein product [Didymodactylos carnosus]CAF1139757.1 unnamed protein product [Didymodactylos carnosus]CAF3635427.1 unnamed protein product [Didymodactylos carnosus]CAF3903395.1 unnamed protein product [Didymodactylos carnosus]